MRRAGTAGQHFFTTGCQIVENSNIDLKRLGENVRFRRQGKGWALNDLAEKSGIGKAYISDLENGVAGKPNIQYVFAIASALGVTLDELLDDAAPKQIRFSQEETKLRSSAGLERAANRNESLGF